MEGNAAKAPNLDPLTAGERVTHPVQERLDCRLDILLREMILIAGKTFIRSDLVILRCF